MQKNSAASSGGAEHKLMAPNGLQGSLVPTVCLGRDRAAFDCHVSERKTSNSVFNLLLQTSDRKYRIKPR